jgi:magnesium transporter
MTTDYLSVTADLTIADVIERIRTVGSDAETVYYIYVLDDQKRLVGVASLRDLLLAPASSARPGEPVRVADLMVEDVLSVGPDTDQEEVARTMAKYDFAALPVLGPDKKLLGVITFDDVMDVLTQEQTEDVQRFAAVEPIEEGYFQTSFWTFIKKRGPWLAALFISEFFTGSALRHYDEVIQAVAKLSYYVPLLISTGGNSGSQSASLIIRGLALGEMTSGDWPKVLVREFGQGLVLGLMLACIGMVRVMMWGDGKGFVLTIGATLIAIPLMGCTVGSMLPLFLRRIGIDPATSSTPFIATLIDVLGIMVYFNVAQIFLAQVIASHLHVVH